MTFNVIIDEDLYEKIEIMRAMEKSRTGWDISTADVLRRAIKIMSENNKLECEK